ncbi:hypothetical protein AYI69_g2819 [Smittium culicis]|uniref:Uncharacterized protein n=1 Tax=Smittium culicis TaxID=133412 RepID=A0A1R1YLH8_9FUNG|nr:hypothetical protein AYI69_g2819 [Smittium culicis]
MPDALRIPETASSQHNFSVTFLSESSAVLPQSRNIIISGAQTMATFKLISRGLTQLPPLHSLSLESVKISSSDFSGMNGCPFHLDSCSFQNFRFWIAGSVRVAVAVQDFGVDNAVLFSSRSLRNIRRPGSNATDIV